MRHDPDAVMIYAAGLGTRMRPLSLDRPKALVRVAGRALIDHALAQVDADPPARIVVNTHAHAAQLERHLQDRPDVVLSHEPQLLETGGGLRAARPLLGDGPVFTLNADAVWSGPSPLTVLRPAWDPARMDALLLLVPRPRAHGHSGSGDFDCAPLGGPVTRPGGMVFTGAQIVKPDLLQSGPEGAFSIWWLWQRLLSAHRLFGCVYPGDWADVGTPEGIPLAEAMLEMPDVRPKP